MWFNSLSRAVWSRLAESPVHALIRTEPQIASLGALCGVAAPFPYSGRRRCSSQGSDRRGSANGASLPDLSSFHGVFFESHGIRDSSSISCSFSRHVPMWRTELGNEDRIDLLPNHSQYLRILRPVELNEIRLCSWSEPRIEPKAVDLSGVRELHVGGDEKLSISRNIQLDVQSAAPCTAVQIQEESVPAWWIQEGTSWECRNVLKKRRRRMNHHKHRKRLKRDRIKNRNLHK